MAKEQAIHALRQFGDEGRAMANRVGLNLVTIFIEFTILNVCSSLGI